MIKENNIRPKEDSILSLIGGTPMCSLDKCLDETTNTACAKLEMFNPTLSIKDRIAKYMVEQAEMRGDIVPGATLVEASSGNTGASLALVAKQKGYRCIITTTEKTSQEKIHLMQN